MYIREYRQFRGETQLLDNRDVWPEIVRDNIDNIVRDQMGKKQR